MYYYTIYNRILASNCPLPELVPSEICNFYDIKLTLNPSLKDETDLPQKIDDIENARITPGRMSFSELKNHYLIHYPDSVLCTVDKQGRHIRADNISSWSPHIRGRFLNNIIGFALYVSGTTVLHGSSVRIDESNGCIGFLGSSGAGKSTLASYFLSTGHVLVSDDIIATEVVDNHVQVVPAYPGIRLWNDSLAEFRELPGQVLPDNKANQKNSLSFVDAGPGLFATSLSQLNKLYILQRGGERVNLKPVSGHRKLIELYQYTIGGKLILKMEGSQQKLNALADIANRLELFTLCYPNGESGLQQLRSAIILD